MKTSYRKILYSLLGIGLLTACTETETIEPPAQRTNRMLTYKVVNTPEAIYGVVNDQDSTVRVYLPHYYYLSVLQADMEVSDGATVTPASGTLLENVTAITRGDTTVYYTVTAADGSKADYRLVVDTRQPALTVNEVSSDPAAPVEFTSSFLYLNKYEIYTRIELTGSNLLRAADGTTLSRAVFIGEDGTEIPAIEVSSNDAASLTVVVPFHEDIPPGLYRLRIDCYSQSVTLKNPVRIKSPQ